MTRLLPAAVVGVCVLTLGAACSGDDKPNSSTTTTRSETVATTTASTSPTGASTSTVIATTSTVTTEPGSTTPSTVTVTDPPDSTASTPVENEDWVTIIQNLVNLRDELYATSDPSRAGEVCAVGAFCYDQLVAQLTDAQSRGEHVVDQGPLIVLSAERESHTDDDGLEIVTVIALIQPSTQYGRIVDAAGNTVHELVPSDPATEPSNIRWTLVRAEVGWRILDQETLP